MDGIISNNPNLLLTINKKIRLMNETQMVVAKANLDLIKYIKNPCISLFKYLVETNNLDKIKYINFKNNYNLQFFIVNKMPEYIKYIDNPVPVKYKEIIAVNPDIIPKIKKKLDFNIEKFIIDNYPEYIGKINHLSDDGKIYCIQTNKTDYIINMDLSFTIQLLLVTLDINNIKKMNYLDTKLQYIVVEKDYKMIKYIKNLSMAVADLAVNKDPTIAFELKNDWFVNKAITKNPKLLLKYGKKKYYNMALELNPLNIIYTNMSSKLINKFNNIIDIVLAKYDCEYSIEVEDNSLLFNFVHDDEMISFHINKDLGATVWNDYHMGSYFTITDMEKMYNESTYLFQGGIIYKLHDENGNVTEYKLDSNCNGHFKKEKEGKL